MRCGELLHSAFKQNKVIATCRSGCVQACPSFHDNVEYFFFLNKFIYFIYLFLVALGLRCCVWVFSSCGEQGLLFVMVRGLLIAVPSRRGSRALGAWVSVVVAHGFSSCGSWALEHRLSSCGAWA